MVRLDFQFCCSKWKHEESGKSLKDYGEDCYLWNISESVIDTIEDEKNGKWSFDEIEALINEEKLIESEG